MRAGRPTEDPQSASISGAMLGLASGAILVPLNSTMLAVALPSVMNEFGVDPATVASLVTLYLGAVAIALPASGSIGDRFGHRRTFLGGVAAFGAASALAAVAPSFEILAASRVLQAISGAFVSTSSVSLLRALAPEDRRGSVFGLFDMLVSTSAAIGPLIGGLLVGSAGWRALFVVAVPVAVLAGIGVAVVARGRDDLRPKPAPARPIDLPGLASLAACLIAVLVALRSWELGGQWAVAIAMVPVLGALFVAIEVRVEQPAVDPRLFVNRAFAAAVVGVFGATMILHGTLVIVPLDVERLLGGDARTSGLVLLGISALGALAAPIGGRASDAVGRREPAIAGMLLAAAGLAGLWFTGPTASLLAVGILLSVVGFGMGMAGSPRQTAALEMIEPSRVGMAAGTYLTGRYVGGALGATLAGAVLGGTVTAAGVGLGFGLLAIVSLAVAGVSVALPRRSPHRSAATVPRVAR